MSITEGELLPIVKESEHPCFDCMKCCTYVAVEIDEPTTNKEYDYVVWYLVHQGVSVFVDWDNSWFIRFDSHCQHLSTQGLCDIYETRPMICKEFEWRECEQHIREEQPDKWCWTEADVFVEWLESKRPKAFKKFQAYLAKKRRKGEEKELQRVKAKITDLPGPPDSPTDAAAPLS
ncbi:MAG: YkgJ family cysteine cluster protein [bacterium]|nr:YkgJ family cysteine cluster protein [bacterium]MCP5066585.1 YkgJ family cysteine cluster protein [bacterium]